MYIYNYTQTTHVHMPNTNMYTCTCTCNTVLTDKFPIAGLTTVILLKRRYSVCSEASSYTTGGISLSLLCRKSRTKRLIQ